MNDELQIYEKLKALNIYPASKGEAGGVYSPVREFGGNMIYVSGVTSDGSDESAYGKLGKEVSVEQGQEAARTCIVKMLGTLHHNLGSLGRIKSFVKLLGFVSSDENFFQQPAVMNGASALLVEIFGEEKGKAARAAIGVCSLPRNVPVEIEALIELYPD